jgi:hypothetical protein
VMAWHGSLKRLRPHPMLHDFSNGYLTPWSCIFHNLPVALLLNNFLTFWNPKVHYHVHKGPSLAPIL